MLIGLGVLLGIVVISVAAEVLYIKYNGTPVPAPNIPRGPQALGAGPKLTYVVMGDSTSIAQGADYADGYSFASAQHLADKYEVTFVNTGISGATAESTLQQQLSDAVQYKPDLVLLAVGANDTTHFTKGPAIQKSIQAIVDGLRAANPDVKIVVTRSPALDSVSRFPFGAKQLMQLRTKQVNAAFEPLIIKNNLTLAPIAEQTRDAFLADSTLTAEDKFHPNASGYALWIPVINQAIDRALADGPTD